MRNAGFIWIIAIIMGAIDLYVFQVVKMLCQGSSSQNKNDYFYCLLDCFLQCDHHFIHFPAVFKYGTLAKKSPELSVCNHRRIFFRQIAGLRFFPGRRSATRYSMGSW